MKKNKFCQMFCDGLKKSIFLWLLFLPAVAMFYFSFRNFSENALFPVYSLGAFFELILPALVTAVNFLLFYRLAKKLAHVGLDSALWLAASFVFGSAYFFAATSGDFLQSMPYLIAVFSMLLAFEEFFGSRRFWLIGLFVALGGIFRPVILLAILFFLLHIFFSSRSLPEKAKRAAILAGPVFLIIIVVFLMSVLYLGHTETIQDGASLGTTVAGYSLKYIPENIQKFMLKGPVPVRQNNISYVLKFPYAVSDGMGMSILFTAPVLFFALFAPWRKKAVKFLWITVAVMAIPVMMAPPAAIAEISYFPAIDLYPIFFILAAMGFAKHINIRTKTVMVLGIILDLYWLITFAIHI